MKTLLPSRALFTVALALAALQHTQANAAGTPPPLVLLRLKSDAKPSQVTPLGAAAYAVDTLAIAGSPGVSKRKHNDIDHILVEPDRSWSTTIRGAASKVSFVSFMVYGSQSTVIEASGARLGITASGVTRGLQLMYDDTSSGPPRWRSLNFSLPIATFGGKPLGALPVLTLRLDPRAGVWDLYIGSKLAAEDLPLIASRKDQKQISVTAGSAGAWVFGVVSADENPLYEDANENGIDDRFEKKARGAIISADASRSERKLLAKQWKDEQRTQRPPAMFVNRPMPDGFVAPVHPKS